MLWLKTTFQTGGGLKKTIDKKRQRTAINETRRPKERRLGARGCAWRGRWRAPDGDYSGRSGCRGGAVQRRRRGAAGEISGLERVDANGCDKRRSASAFARSTADGQRCSRRGGRASSRAPHSGRAAVGLRRDSGRAGWKRRSLDGMDTSECARRARKVYLRRALSKREA